jgi:hypothetical protein
LKRNDLSKQGDRRSGRFLPDGAGVAKQDSRCAILPIPPIAEASSGLPSQMRLPREKNVEQIFQRKAK